MLDCLAYPYCFHKPNSHSKLSQTRTFWASPSHLHKGIWGWHPDPKQAIALSNFTPIRHSPLSLEQVPVPLPPPPASLPVPKPNIASHPKLDITPEEQIESLEQELRANNDLPEQCKASETIGKSIGLMHSQARALHHPAAPLLLSYATNGCPVDCGPDWPRDLIEKLISRGPHPSAKIPAAAEQLRQETAQKV